MLKCTEINQELITDINMHQMIEKGIRGGVCQVISQYAKKKTVNTRIKTLIKKLTKEY